MTLSFPELSGKEFSIDIVLNCIVIAKTCVGCAYSTSMLSVFLVSGRYFTVIQSLHVFYNTQEYVKIRQDIRCITE